jgi:hypothetical protein
MKTSDKAETRRAASQAAEGLIGTVRGYLT